MKFLCEIFIFFFLVFLTTPTIVSFIDKDADISFFYNVEEDEKTISLDEIKSIPCIYSIPLVVDFEGSQKVKFGILNDTKLTSIVLNIFLLPPEIV